MLRLSGESGGAAVKSVPQAGAASKPPSQPCLTSALAQVRSSLTPSSHSLSASSCGLSAS